MFLAIPTILQKGHGVKKTKQNKDTLYKRLSYIVRDPNYDVFLENKRVELQANKDNDRLALEDLIDTATNSKQIQNKVANPRDPLHTQECSREYERGLKSKLSVKIRQKRQHNEDKRNADILNLREHIVKELLSSKIVTETEQGISTINPGILKILEIKHIDNSE